MVEGPGVHRVAIAHRQILLGRRYTASSPSGKFQEGAAAISGQVLSCIEAHGKNIFYFFTQNEQKNADLEGLPHDTIVVHIHFGMSGSFRNYSFPGPEPRPATRLRLVNEKEKIVAHLSATLCKHGNIEFYRDKVERLGPDPLRKDADKEIFWENLQRSRKGIGALLMDQSLIAGIGNIYRSELLFVTGVHPDLPASSLTYETFEVLWSEAQRLLQVGVVTGSIITVSPEEAGKPFSKLRKGEKRYIYNQRNCRRCHNVIRIWKSAQRTVYACESCQPLLKSIMPKASHKTDILTEEIPQRNNNAVHTTSIQSCQAVNHDVTTKLLSSVHKKRKRRSLEINKKGVVEHQALKDITTGGLLEFCLDDVFLQGIAPNTPEKPILSGKNVRAPKRGKIKDNKKMLNPENETLEPSKEEM